MEQESFSSPEVAEVLNNFFVPIKVDREERPDIDAIYMNFVQATTGGGGWPLNVFLTPDLEPVFGGTYFPGPGRASIGGGLRHGVSLLDILTRIKNLWKDDEQRCRESAREVTEQLKEFAEEGVHSHDDGISKPQEDEGLDLELLEEAYQDFERNYDRDQGGFSKPPKFPNPAHLSFLIRLGQWPDAVKHVVGEKECENAVTMVVHTLRQMARGGIRDQVGYGFSRYSVTKDWKLPHFEKMLYDQAQLLNVYLDTFLITKDPEMLGAVLDIADYLTTQPMISPEGGFYSAEDADSYPTKGAREKREGAYYVWSLQELKRILGEHHAEVFAKFYGARDDGNISRSQDPHDEFVGQNVLTVTTSPAALAKTMGLKEAEVVAILKDGRKRLREFREHHRPRPALDDKIIVAWNGLALGALARAHAALKDIDPERSQSYGSAAATTVQFIRDNLFDHETKTLWRIYRQGRGDVPGFCDDYAFLIQGLIDLYEATFTEEYLQFADTLQSTLPPTQSPPHKPPSAHSNSILNSFTTFFSKTAETQNQLFLSPSSLGYFSTPSPQSPDLLLRLKSGMDAAEPSPNGVSAANLHRLASMLDDKEYARLARSTVAAFEAEIEQYPHLFVGMLGSVVAARLGVKGVVLTGGGGRGGGVVAEEVEKHLRGEIGVGRTVVRVREGDAWLRGRSRLLGEVHVGRETVMVCEGGACREGVEFL